MSTTRLPLEQEEALRVFDSSVGLREHERVHLASVRVGRSMRTIRRWVAARKAQEAADRRRRYLKALREVRA